MIVMSHRVLRSSRDIIISLTLINDIQSNVLMIRPENIVDKDQVEALKDKASELLFWFVCLIINGNEQTLISIIPMPHARKDNWIIGTMEK